MDTILWIGQGILSTIFLGSGIMKSTQSEEWLVNHGQTGVAVTLATHQIHRLTEILGAVGLIMPWWLGIAPILTPVSAVGFSLIMILAGIIHYRLKEPRNVIINAIIFLVCGLVAYGRFMDLNTPE